MLNGRYGLPFLRANSHFIECRLIDSVAPSNAVEPDSDLPSPISSLLCSPASSLCSPAPTSCSSAHREGAFNR